MTSDEIQSKWREGRSPVLNGILRASGRSTALQIHIGDPYDASTYRLEIVEANSPDNLNTVDEAFISEMYEVCDYVRDQKAGCGETSLEAEGFVALSRAKSGDLIWLAIFENVGAFRECRLLRDRVAALSEYDVWWYFPIDSPENLAVRSTLDA